MEKLKNLIEDYFKTQSSEVANQIAEIVKDISIDDIKNNTDLFHALVPFEGKALTIAGEILRALHRIGYMFYGEDEHYFEGEGIKDCGSNAVYLMNHTNHIISNLIGESIPINFISQGAHYYNTAFETIVNLVRMFLVKNPQLFLNRNTVDSTRDYTTKAQELFEEYDLMINEEEGDAQWKDLDTL